MSIEKNRIIIDTDMRALVDVYLTRREAELQVLQQALEERNFDELSNIGHQLKGSGAAYGFAEYSELGHALEVAAQANDIATAELLVQQLAQYYAGIEIIDADSTNAAV